MIIKTMHFGEIEIDEKTIIVFEEGIPGFDDTKKFVILNDSENDTPFKWLQAVDEVYPALAMISPFEINMDYEIDVDSNTIDLLGIKNTDDVVIYSVVVIPEDVSKMTANLRAPIIINVANNKGCQMIMDNSSYQVKHYILEELVKANESEVEEGK